MNGNLQDSPLAQLQAANLYLFTMHDPVNFTDPSGLVAYSVRHPQSGGFALEVIPQSLELALRTQDIIGFGGATMGGWLAGWHSINLGINWGAIGLAGDIAWMASRGVGLLPNPPGVIAATLDVGIALYNQQWLIAQTVDNHFNGRLWVSDTRRIVENKFSYSMNEMTLALAQGRVEIRNSTDVFGAAAFTRGRTDYQFDPLTGGNRAFHQDSYYFFKVCETSRYIIRDVQQSVVDQWGFWGSWHG